MTYQPEPNTDRMMFATFDDRQTFRWRSHRGQLATLIVVNYQVTDATPDVLARYKAARSMRLLQIC